ncbi:MAG: hypothetical protein BWY20_02103 [Spirochaetes bacterium ADurb.Bin215]|nr:MAG: hypothetical protein BWY20_02103 [Spirochaetes bacterium ADurb.Bin215]
MLHVRAHTGPFVREPQARLFRTYCSEPAEIVHVFRYQISEPQESRFQTHLNECHVGINPLHSGFLAVEPGKPVYFCLVRFGIVLPEKRDQCFHVCRAGTHNRISWIYHYPRTPRGSGTGKKQNNRNKRKKCMFHDEFIGGNRPKPDVFAYKYGWRNP